MTSAKMATEQVKAIVQQLHDLSRVKANRVSIVKDNGCLPGLTQFLDNEEEEVVHLVLETLLMLSEEEENQPIMYSDIKFVRPIKTILENPKISPQTKMVAVKLFKNIQPHSKVQPPSPQAPAPTPSEKEKIVKEVSSKHNTGMSFINVSGKKSKHICLQLMTAHEDVAWDKIKDSLLKVRGLVSFTYNTKAHQLDIRTIETVQASTIITIVRQAGLRVQQVVKGKGGEDILLDEEEAPTHTDTDGYLDEQVNLHEKPVSSNTLARRNNSRTDKGGWMGSVGTFISKNLYW